MVYTSFMCVSSKFLKILNFNRSSNLKTCIMQIKYHQFSA